MLHVNDPSTKDTSIKRTSLLVLLVSVVEWVPLYIVILSNFNYLVSSFIIITIQFLLCTFSEITVENFDSFLHNMEDSCTKMKAKFVDHCNKMSGRKSTIDT